MTVNDNINVEAARIGFKNFAGKESQFNRKGDRNFCVFFDREIGEDLQTAGWNIKWLEPREEGDDATPYLQVSVSYNNYPPKIVLITSSGKSVLSESEVDILDWAEIKNIDLVIRPYNWEVSGKSGVKAYVKAMYVTIEEDEFSSKYADIPGN